MYLSNVLKVIDYFSFKIQQVTRGDICLKLYVCSTSIDDKMKGGDLCRCIRNFDPMMSDELSLYRGDLFQVSESVCTYSICNRNLMDII